MTKLLEQAIEKVRELPEHDQDIAAEQLIQHVDAIPTLNDLAVIAEGREAFKRGDFVSLEQWRHDMGLGNR
jgi:hypothetical protein